MAESDDNEETVDHYAVLNVRREVKSISIKNMKVQECSRAN